MQVTSPDQTRGTQSFVGTLSSCFRRPSLIALEVLWRWTFGIPALAFAGIKVRDILLTATAGTLDPATLGLDHALLNDPVGTLSADPAGAAGKFARALGIVLPGILHFAIWFVPLALTLWIIVSSLGRSAVLRRAARTLHTRPFTLMLLQLVRLLALGAVFALWFALVAWSTRTTVTTPIALGAEPNLVLFCGLVIVASLGLFTAWAFVSWIFLAAPLLAMQEDLGFAQSLKAAFRTGPKRGQLMEINLVLGIVKIALIVLAMVFSATPLPFEAVTTPEFLGWWWGGVALLYLLWSDFFHVARLVGYLGVLTGSDSSSSRELSGSGHLHPTKQTARPGG